jgi:hypothetical protein
MFFIDKLIEDTKVVMIINAIEDHADTILIHILVDSIALTTGMYLSSQPFIV